MAVEYHHRTPRHFTLAERIKLNMVCIPYMIPAALGLVLMGLATMNTHHAILLLSGGFAIFVVSIASVLCFIPFLLGNKRIKKRFLSSKNGAIVQVTYKPCTSSILEHILDDADDIGFLTVEEDYIEYSGDSSDFKIDKSNVMNIKKRNVGFRGIWLIGDYIQLDINAAPEDIIAISIYVREGMTTRAARLHSRTWYARLMQWKERCA